MKHTGMAVSQERSRIIAEGFVPIPESLRPTSFDDLGDLPTRWGGRGIALEINVPVPSAVEEGCAPVIVDVMVQQGSGTQPRTQGGQPLSAGHREFLRVLGQRLGRDWAAIMMNQGSSP